MPMKKLYARKLIKQFISNQKEKTFTTKQCNYWWNILNIAVFEGKLQTPSFAMRKTTKYFGECFGYSGKEKAIKIIITTANTNNTEFIATIVHEMVHQWQYTVDASRKMTHGKSFLTWRPKISRTIGIQLHKYGESENLTPHMKRKLKR